MSEEQQYYPQDEPDASADQYQVPQNESYHQEAVPEHDYHDYDVQVGYHHPDEPEAGGQGFEQGEEEQYHDSALGPDDQVHDAVDDLGHAAEADLAYEEQYQQQQQPHASSAPEPDAVVQGEPSYAPDPSLSQSGGEYPAPPPQQTQQDPPSVDSPGSVIPQAPQQIGQTASAPAPAGAPESGIPQVIVTSDSQQSAQQVQQSTPPVLVQDVAAAPAPASDPVQPQTQTQPAPQVIVVPTAAAPAPQPQPQPQQVFIQSPQPLIQQQPPMVFPHQTPIQTQPFATMQPGVPMIAGAYSAAGTVPMVVQADYTEQNVSTVWNNLSAALVGSPPPSASPVGGRGSGSTRTPRTSQTRIPAPLISAPGPAPGSSQRYSPPRQPASPPTPSRNSAFLQATPVTTPIAEHPEFELYESPQQEYQARPQILNTQHGRNDSLQTGEGSGGEHPPTPPPAHLKPRPPSIVFAGTSAAGYAANAHTLPMRYSPDRPTSNQAQGQVVYVEQPQPPHILRRANTASPPSTSGSGSASARPSYERRVQSFDDSGPVVVHTHSPSHSQHLSTSPSRRSSLHASVPVGGIVDGRVVEAQARASLAGTGAGAGADVDFGPDGRVHMHLTSGGVGVGAGMGGRQENAEMVRREASVVRREADVMRHEASDMARREVDMARREVDVARGEVNAVYRQGTDVYRQTQDTVRQGVEGFRTNSARAVSFVEEQRGALVQGLQQDVTRAVNVQNLASGAGSLVAGWVTGGGLHGGNGHNGNGGGGGMGNGGNGGGGGGGGGGGNPMTVEGHLSRASGLDTFIPYAGSLTKEVGGEKTVEKRLEPTLNNAKDALSKARLQAKINGWSLNVAIGAQVLLGALTTGIAAATTGKTTSVVTSILGGISTLAASYLAKARGSGEPENSSHLAKELENYVRDCEAFLLDHGHKRGEESERMKEFVEEYRRRFEILMGSNGDQVVDNVEEKRILDGMRSGGSSFVGGSGHASGMGRGRGSFDDGPMPPYGPHGNGNGGGMGTAGRRGGHSQNGSAGYGNGHAPRGSWV
ncbi:hypothetical protein EIP91_012020 [Steccherinum ochraceum]|uniref:SMODS and SLOG-associating 2TM effector domain-containing protein n=1 Tax=Steccherinum ochraceum TaxID=92696 RepID=A0A4R0RKR3_9APHY|nr:hypothetical protein EIP91_012020 [Steccherinum ochraceum]